MHVVDETGRKRHLVENHTLGARERLAEQVAVDLMAGDVPSGEYLLLDLLDVEQLDFRHGYLPPVREFWTAVARAAKTLGIALAISSSCAG
ncbi:MAG: hypothetical protein WB777_22775 [Mycobacterium sp.]